MLDVRWSGRTQRDLRRIADYWLANDPERLAAAITAIGRRVEWLADNHHRSGNPIAGLPRDFRWYLERTYDYKIYYRVEGNPPDTLSVIAIRHGRERPISPSTLRHAR